MNQLIHFLKKQGVNTLAYLAILLSLVSIFSNIISNVQVDKNTGWVNHTYLVLKNCDNLSGFIKDCQIGQRGYLLSGKPDYLTPYITGKTSAQQTLATLKELTIDNAAQQQRLHTIDNNLQQAFAFIDKTVEAVQKHGADSAQSIILANDEGKTILTDLGQHISEITQAELTLLEERNQAFASVKFRGQFIQIAAVLLILVVLVLLTRVITKSKNKLAALFIDLDKRNDELIMQQAGQQQQEKDENQVVQRLITNLQHAIEFIRQIGQGKYEAELQGIDNQDREANRDNLAGSLIQMREQLKQVAEEDRKRNWATAGQASFAELLRDKSADMKELSFTIITTLVKYLGANQGGIFSLHQPESGEAYLELAACYAYDRRKYIHKRIALGEGLIGQCVLEADTIYLTQIPSGYVEITSGLGKASPSCLLIVPLKLNNQIYGVVEIASFNPFEPYQITYAEKVAESIASTLSMAKVNESTKILLEQAQQQGEMLRAQEEEMRQNMEELNATQEEVIRRQHEVTSLLQRFDLAAQTTTEGLWDMMVPDSLSFKDDTHFWWSDRFREMVGYTNERDFPNRLDSWANLLHAEDKSQTMAAFQAHLVDFSGQTPYNVEYRLQLKNGTYKWFRAVGNTLRNENGKPLRVAGSLIDIQHLKERNTSGQTTSQQGLEEIVG